MKFHVKFYVVPDMTIELLLGDDFHLNYELQVLQNLELRTHVKVGETVFTFSATSTTANTDAAERRDIRVARGFTVHDLSIAEFIHSKTHQRQRANRYRRKWAHSNGTIQAWEDVLILAETTA